MALSSPCHVCRGLTPNEQCPCRCVEVGCIQDVVEVRVPQKATVSTREMRVEEDAIRGQLTKPRPQ